MNKRQTTAAVLFLIGFLLIVGAFGQYDFAGYIDPNEFLRKTVTGLALMAAAIPVSGELNELFRQPSEKRKNRR